MANIPTNGTVAAFIDERLREISKTDRQVAQDAGLGSAHALKLMAKGDIKVPLDRVESLAEALDVDPADLLRLVMREYMPGTWNSIENIVGGLALTEDERAMVLAYRQVIKNGDDNNIETKAKRSAAIASWDINPENRPSAASKSASSDHRRGRDGRSEALRLRCAIELPRIGWRAFSASKALKVYLDGHPLPDFANKRIRVAFVYIRASHGMDARIARLDVSAWPFDKDGRIDESEVMKDIHANLESQRQASTPGQLDVDLSAKEIREISDCLGLSLNAPGA